MARIPKETVDQIIHTADILEVVGDYVQLKRQGQNYWACCPFHNEKSPSFSVAPAKGFYKCFGCGKSGNVVNFVMDIEGSSYPEALRAFSKLLEAPGGDQYLEEIALITGELYRTTELTRDGRSIRVSASGKLASYESGTGGSRRG